MSKYGTARYGQSLYGSTAEHPYAGIAGKVMWMVQVDWNRDGVFSETEPQSISRLRIRRGRERRMRADGLGQLQPGNERFEIEILDPARRYDSFNLQSPIYNYLGAPGLLLRVVMVSTTSKAPAQAVYVGTLTSVNYDSLSGRAVLRGEGLARALQVGAAAAVFAPCQPVTAAWDSCFVQDGSTPFPINYWKGRPGGLSLKECAKIILDRAGWTLGAYYGAQVFNNEQPDYFYLDGATAWESLKDLADGFCARLFFLRDGRIFVMDRLDTLGQAAALAAPARAQETYGVTRDSSFESLRNRAEVRIRPHNVRPFVTPIPNSMFVAAWTNGGPVEVQPGSYLDINVRYSEANLGVPKQGNWARVNTDALTESKPLVVNSKADKSGVNMGFATGNGQGEYTLLLQNVGENQNGLIYVQYGNKQNFCTVRLRNWSNVDTAYFFDLQVQVIGLVETGDKLTSITEDAASINANGARVVSVNSRWIQNPLMAANIGQAYIGALSTRERASVVKLTYQWSGDLLYNNLLAYDVGCHVDFGAAGGADSNNNFGIAGKWLIVGQRLEWMSPDGQDALVELTFERPAITRVQAGNVSSKSGANVTSLTWSHTVPQGNNRLLLVTIAKRDTGGMSASVTYGGAAMSRVAGVSQGAGDFPYAEIWYKIAPPVGTADVVVTFSQADYAEAGALDFTNVNQVTPLGNPGRMGTAWGAAGPAIVNLGALDGDLLVDCVCYRGVAGGPGAGQMLRWAGTSDNVWRGGCSTQPGAPAVEMRWIIPAGGFALIAVALWAAGG